MRCAKHFATPGQILPDLFRERDWGRQWALHDVYARWPDLVGAEAAAHSAPVAVRNGLLWLYVRHAVWAQELQFRQADLLRRARALMPECCLSGIRCRVEPSWFTEDAPPAPPCPPAEPVPDSFSIIPDTPCREALIRLWQTLRAGRR